jgi:hypothetical protein
MSRVFFLFFVLSNVILAQRPQIGAAIPHTEAHLAASAGYAGIIDNLSKNLSPSQVSYASARAFLKNTETLPCPMYAYNIFIPAEYKLVGPNVNEPKVLAYVDSILARLATSPSKLVIWGSGGARRIPEGWPKTKATKQFVSIAKKIAEIAQNHGITLSLESLNSTETNFLNTVAEALYVVKKVNHPALRLNVDIYHMMMDHEGPEIILKTKKYINHVEIAEPNGRTAPGVQGTDFKPYFSALKKINYNRMIAIEGRWASFESIAAPAKAYLELQLSAVGY